jgi:uncharacterized repeat protein (TIGR03803 family)
MHNQSQSRSCLYREAMHAVIVGLAIAVLLALAGPSAQAQTFQVLYTFTGGMDGASPEGLTMDRDGRLYGSTAGGGHGNCNGGCGTVFRLAQAGSTWQLTTLYAFAGGGDGPAVGGPVIGLNGSLFLAADGGGGENEGAVINLTPPATACKTALCYWTKTEIFQFNIYNGLNPVPGIVVDRAGNLFGTTELGGAYCYPAGCGVVYELTPTDGNWADTTLHSFGSGYPYGDGWYPLSGVVLDGNGNAYGTTPWGGTNDCGIVYSDFGNRIIHEFQCRFGGSGPSGLIIDQEGNLYGTVGTTGGSAVFEMSPSNGGWTYTIQYVQPGGDGMFGLTMDTAGNLYGVTGFSNLVPGSIFKLTRSGAGWTYTDIYDFTGGSDGLGPNGLILDANGNLYGTASDGGNLSDCVRQYFSGCGTLWKITF